MFASQNNYIKTSKYSVLTFLPLNLFEQFQRLANFYFLCLLVLQLIPAISSLTPVTTAIPLIGVLTLTAVKDAYDDIVSLPLMPIYYLSACLFIIYYLAIADFIFPSFCLSSRILFLAYAITARIYQHRDGVCTLDIFPLLFFCILDCIINDAFANLPVL